MYLKRSVLVLLVIAAVAFCFCATPLPLPPDAPTAQDVISFVKQSIDWYRHFSTEQRVGTEAGDITFVDDNRRLSEQIIGLSFDFAQAEADLLANSTPAAQPGAPADQNQASSRYQSLLQSATKADQRVQQSRDQIQILREKLATAPPSKRRVVESAIAENESELRLAQTRSEVLRSMVEFMSGASGKGGSAGGLATQIEELRKAVPGLGVKTTESTSAYTSNMAVAKPEPTGILALINELRSLASKRAELDDAIRMTDALAVISKNLRTPLGKELRRLAGEGDALANEPDSDDPGVLAQQKEALDSTTTQFKRLSAVVIPLGKQGILLDLYKGGLVNWRTAVQTQFSARLKSLVLRLVLLAVVLAVVIGASEIWKRAIIRYIHDVKRRHQFLLLRRILLWIVIAIIVAVAFATELGSLATFAGLLTAGVAVALQNVILSIAGYFFLIGSRGIRVGDRVQVSGVTGEVVDIGLVRLHLMELGGSGADAQPTGRVVVFSNSVVFQSTAGFFKQIPGTNFVWHEMKLTLAPESDYRAVEQRLVGAVEAVFDKYRENMEHQRKRMERALSTISVNALRPQSRLCLTQTGLDVVIRYPVELEKAAEIDDHITREVLDAIERKPKLRLVGTGTPNIQPVNEPARASHGSD